MVRCWSVLRLICAGAGKTRTSYAVIGEFLRQASDGVGKKSDRRKKALFLVHRVELLNQAKAEFQTLYPETSVSEFNCHSKSFEGEMVFATMQSLTNSLEKIPVDEIAVVVVDECHHVKAESYERILKHMMRRAAPDAQDEFKTLGITATPNRSDKKCKCVCVCICFDSFNSIS